ncbi:beta-1,3-glucosyltransferase [Bacillus sp. JCM 19047]|nr:beta-1,3-glucosyltransferase [Bacillus sp. JCM 19047]
MRVELSIIIPVYNGEKTIIDTLESIILQGEEDYEVLIIDDGSTDNTSNVVKKFIESNKRFNYYYQKNQGVSMSRNNGIKLAKGRYICFLDSDDSYEEKFISKMLYRVNTSENDVVFCGYYTDDLNGKKIKKTKFDTKRILENYILGRNAIHTNCWVLRRQFVLEKRLFFQKGVNWGEDFEFFCEVLLKTSKVCSVKEYLTTYKLLTTLTSCQHLILQRLMMTIIQ